jgi:hypothetical protein
MTERDDTVSKRYRELPAEEPPRALDEAILAASRRAVQAGPAASPWAPGGRWQVPLAAAAVIMLAVGLTLRVQVEQPQEEVARIEPQAAPSATLEQAKKDEAKAAAGPERKLEEPRAAASERRARERTAAPSTRNEAPAPFPGERAAREDSGAPAAQADMRAAEGQARQGPSAAKPESPPAPVSSVPAPAPAPQAEPAPPRVAAAAPRADDAARDRAAGALASGATAKRMQEMPETPEKALERIAELRKAGKHDEADKALAEFRKRYPDFKLSDEMKAKVERR